MITRTITHSGPADKLYTADGTIYYWSFIDKTAVMTNMVDAVTVSTKKSATKFVVTFTFDTAATMAKYDELIASAVKPDAQPIDEYRTANGITRTVVVS